MFNPNDMQNKLENIFSEVSREAKTETSIFVSNEIEYAETFAESGTGFNTEEFASEKGLVIHMNDGSIFELSIKQVQ